MILILMTNHFNSHAHVERDQALKQLTKLAGISTHTLTWSVTAADSQPLFAVCISTHTLTWSVTRWNRRRGRWSEFQLTRSRGAWQKNAGQRKDGANFNSHAHVERDLAITVPSSDTEISTHTLTWSVTEEWNMGLPVLIISTHTLTWSVTIQTKTENLELKISTHTLTWSVTLYFFACV